MGGKSSSSSSSNQTTTTRDERIAATDNAVVVKESLNNLTSITTIDGGAFEFGEMALDSNARIALEVIKGAQGAINKNYESVGMGLDKVLEFIGSKEEDSNSSNLQKTLPWIMAGVSLYAIATIVRK